MWPKPHLTLFCPFFVVKTVVSCDFRLNQSHPIALYDQDTGSKEPGSRTDHLSTAQRAISHLNSITTRYHHCLSSSSFLTHVNPNSTLTSRFKFWPSALPRFSGTCPTPSTSKGTGAAAFPRPSASAGRSSGWDAGRSQPVRAPRAVHQRPERKMLISTRSPGAAFHPSRAGSFLSFTVAQSNES